MAIEKDALSLDDLVPRVVERKPFRAVHQRRRRARRRRLGDRFAIRTAIRQDIRGIPVTFAGAASRARGEFFQPMISRSDARFRCILILAGAIMMSASGPASVQFAPSPQSTQEAVFQQTCAVCHNNSATRAPARELAARDVARFHRRGADQRHHESARLEPFA